MKSLLTLGTLIVLSSTIPLLGQQTPVESDGPNILTQLLQQGRSTWVRTGTMEIRHTEHRAPILTDPAAIEAKIQQALAEFDVNPGKIVKTAELQAQHREAIPFNVRYKYANEITTTTYEVVRVDRDRHSQDITIESRNESISKPGSLAYNEMTSDMDIQGNRRRILAWDGQDYTLYLPSTGLGIVDAGYRFNHSQVGALKAGLIPWGRGIFTLRNLWDAQSTWKTASKGEIAVTYTWDTGTEFTATFDVSKFFAVLRHSLLHSSGTLYTTELADHRKVNGVWIPHEIMTERFDTNEQRVLGYDLWEILDISTATPGPSEFKPEFQEDTFVSHYSPLSKTPLRYHHNSRVDTQELLARRLNVRASGHDSSQNCATLSMGYAVEELGTSIPEHKLKGINEGGMTSLLQMKSLAQGMGLSAEVVKTDIDGLEAYEEAQVILHLTDRKHFVVLDRVVDGNAWFIDLFRNRFYYPISLQRLADTWSEGIALVLSKQRISVPGTDTVVTDSGASLITGGWVGPGTCTGTLQPESAEYCPEPPGCMGTFVYNFWIKECEYGPTGTCDDTIWLTSTMSTECVYDAFYDECGQSIWEFDMLQGCLD